GHLALPGGNRLRFGRPSADRARPRRYPSERVRLARRVGRSWRARARPIGAVSPRGGPERVPRRRLVATFHRGALHGTRSRREPACIPARTPGASIRAGNVRFAPKSHLVARARAPQVAWGAVGPR